MKKAHNKNGSILITTIFILVILIMAAVSFATTNLTDMMTSRRYFHSIAAFWLAEAGVNMYMSDPSMLDESPSVRMSFGGGEIYLSRDDSKTTFRYINATGIYGGIRRKIQITYPMYMPEVYKHAMSSKGSLMINGAKTSAVLMGQVRVGGIIDGTSKNANVFFDDSAQNVDPLLTSLEVNSPDQLSNANTLANFIKNNQRVVSKYPADQILYVKDAADINLTADLVKGKKIIYIENSSGGGNVTINNNTLVEPNQSLTIITTGEVNFNQSGEQADNSQLNILAWGNYNESVSAPSSHRGLIYTHGTATYNNIMDTSVSNGGVIADGGIVLGDIWSTKIFNYADMTSDGFYPAGFENYTGTSISKITSNPIAWKEINQ